MHEVVGTETSVTIPIGNPVSNTVVEIRASRNDEPDVGELLIGGSGLARGYLHAGEPASSQFVEQRPASTERFFATGDVCRQLPDGSFEFLGRRDDLVKIFGHRVSTTEVEAALYEQQGVCHAAVVETRVANSAALAAYVTATRKLSVMEIRTRLAKRLPKFMIPSRITILAELPLLPNGKVDYRHLRDNANPSGS